MHVSSGKQWNSLIWLLLLPSALNCAKVEVLEGYGKLSEEFENERELEMKIGNQIRKLKLSKHSIVTPSHRTSQNDTQVSVYGAADQSVICTEECNGSNSCERRCLVERDTDYVYIKDNKALTVRNDESVNFPSDDSLMDIQEILNKKNSEAKRNRRDSDEGIGGKLLMPNIQTDTAIVKLRLMMDVALLQRFIDFVDTGVLQDAKDEIERFFTILLNRVTLYYRALKEMEVTFNSTDNVTFPLDFAFSIESIAYPPQNEKDGSFHDIAAIVANRKDGILITKIYSGQNGIFSDVGGLVVDFADYMYDLYKGVPQPFDLVHFMTGDGMAFDFYSKKENETVFLRRKRSLGIATIGAMCFDYRPFKTDRRFGFSAYNDPAIARIVAHELGHNLGSRHDITSKCPQHAFNVMAGQAPPVFANLTKFYNWSDCSANDIAGYFSWFSSEQLATCWYTNNPTKADFRKQFCAGVPGQTFDINEQCKLLFGKGSFLCTGGKSNLKAGYVEADQCLTVLEPTGFRPILHCARNNSCDGSKNEIMQLFDGTRCSSDKGTDDDDFTKICYEGQCQRTGEICDDVEDGDEDDDEDDEDEDD